MGEMMDDAFEALDDPDIEEAADEEVSAVRIIIITITITCLGRECPIRNYSRQAWRSARCWVEITCGL